jgi:hypothetical protein
LQLTTEVRDYVNGGSASSCFGGGSVSGGGAFASVSTDSDCFTRLRACHNVFYIKNGFVERYAPSGSGGARCMTGETTRPDYIVVGVQ